MKTFEIKARWKGGLDGLGSLTGPGLETKISVPADLKGIGVGTNPEELFLGAAASCFLITTAAILARMNVPAPRLEIQSELEVEVGQGLTIKKIIHRPTLFFSQDLSMELLKKAGEAIALAETYCVISKAVRENVKVEVLADFVKEAERINPIKSPQIKLGEVSGSESPLSLI